MKASLVVFDIAGTTVRDSGDVARFFAGAFADAGLEIPESATYPVMGYRKSEAILRLLQQFFPEKMVDFPRLVTEIHQRFEASMIAFYQELPTLEPLPGAEDLFASLKGQGIRVALNTGFTRNITQSILQRLEWDKSPLIDAVVCSDEVPEGRPFPFMIRMLMEKTGIADVHAVVKIGDTEVDILEGRNAGCGKVISVTTGGSTREELMALCPDAVCDSLLEVQSMLLKS